MAQSVERPTSAQVMSSQLMSLSPTWVCVADSSEPGACFGFCVCVCISLSALLMLCLCLKNKMNIKKIFFNNFKKEGFFTEGKRTIPQSQCGKATF